MIVALRRSIFIESPQLSNALATIVVFILPLWVTKETDKRCGQCFVPIVEKTADSTQQWPAAFWVALAPVTGAGNYCSKYLVPAANLFCLRQERKDVAVTVATHFLSVYFFF